MVVSAVRFRALHLAISDDVEDTGCSFWGLTFRNLDNKLITEKLTPKLRNPHPNQHDNRTTHEKRNHRETATTPKSNPPPRPTSKTNQCNTHVHTGMILQCAPSPEKIEAGGVGRSSVHAPLGRYEAIDSCEVVRMDELERQARRKARRVGQSQPRSAGPVDKRPMSDQEDRHKKRRLSVKQSVSV